ncbi:MAG TPA: hypothetical protein VJ875_07140 [Pyrinomonadaceae bacterium]|nr:hypothetical protein [Pyrinomonadaceae bacterium]
MISAETWKTIANVVIPFIAAIIGALLNAYLNPFFNEYWSTKRNRATASPAANQPKQRIERIKPESHSRLKKFAAAMLGTGLPLGALVVAMSRPVITRWTVLAIAVCVNWIAVQVAISVSVYTVYRIWFSLKNAT